MLRSSNSSARNLLGAAELLGVSTAGGAVEVARGELAATGGEDVSFEKAVISRFLPPSSISKSSRVKPSTAWLRESRTTTPTSTTRVSVLKVYCTGGVQAELRMRISSGGTLCCPNSSAATQPRGIERRRDVYSFFITKHRFRWLQNVPGCATCKWCSGWCL